MEVEKNSVSHIVVDLEHVIPTATQDAQLAVRKPSGEVCGWSGNLKKQQYFHYVTEKNDLDELGDYFMDSIVLMVIKRNGQSAFSCISYSKNTMKICTVVEHKKTFSEEIREISRAALDRLKDI